jgi:hypothetical protein
MKTRRPVPHHEGIPFESEYAKFSRPNFPPTQKNLFQFYKDLKAAFQKFRSFHPYADIGILYLKPQRFRVCWTVSDPNYPYVPRYGEVLVFSEDNPLELVDCEGDFVSAVRIGLMTGYPMDGSYLYYCPENDMVYYYPLEALETEGRNSDPPRVFAFRRFIDLLGEFAEFGME